MRQSTVIITGYMILFWYINGCRISKAYFVQFNSTFAGLGIKDGMVQGTFKSFCQSVSAQVGTKCFCYKLSHSTL